ncbi:hypothetical protein JG688_00003973 [Phytophthora aleatoria]|uniref:Uncharacterized protein n=1 Tax=Phytophthora aleatoria TaxID=2496075 RepID=A0A8J5IRY0_9STRA|nr:hypothetical protein JG688_00003973 [Phytophthora aleatoria]
MSTPPPPPDDLNPALGPIIISHVNAGVEFIDNLANDDERDELVEQMNLHGNSIQSMDGLEAFTGLVELCLSSNNIEEISFHALQPLVHLRVLDLSANSISSTLGFPQLPRLEELSMAHNCIQGLDGLTRPIKFPKLQYLDLRGNAIVELNDLVVLQRLKRLAHLRLQAANGDQANPVCDLDGYPHAIIQMLPKLALLDEEERLREAEERLQQKMATLEKSENETKEITGELELARKTHEAIVTQLSDEVKYHKDRAEQADKRNIQLEKQVTELKANVETVYNKCIEKDEAIQQLKKNLIARQDEIDALRSQHEKDSERQDKLQQQQQDLYERQLQSSIIQVEMEFRKEFQQSAQRFQSLQRKTQERMKEVKRVREAYQVSLQREAAAKAQIEKLEAILADDKKKLSVEDAKRSDTFKAEIRQEKSKREELEHRLIEEQKKYAQVAVLTVERDEKTIENERLREEIRHEKLSAKLEALEKEAPKKEDQLISLRTELEQKVSALESISSSSVKKWSVLE